MKFLYTIAVLMAAHFISSAQNPSLTAIWEKDKNDIKLRWQHPDERITSYVVQRSSDNVFFTDVCIRQTTGIRTGELLKFSDENISAEKNYYRLKIFRGSGMYEATLPVMVVTGNTQTGWIIYPVPVQSVLHLQYSGSGPIEGVIAVTIQSVASGTVFTRLRVSSNNRNIEIPVSNLGKGLYDIRVYIGDEIKWNQRFVK